MLRCSGIIRHKMGPHAYGQQAQFAPNFRSPCGGCVIPRQHAHRCDRTSVRRDFTSRLIAVKLAGEESPFLPGRTCACFSVPASR